MYKITSKIIGSIKIGNKDISYGGFIIVDKLTQEIIDNQQNKVIKVKQIIEKKAKDEKNQEQIDEIKKERKNKKQDKNIDGGN
jgi:uncharacterized protein YcnI